MNEVELAAKLYVTSNKTGEGGGGYIKRKTIEKHFEF